MAKHAARKTAFAPLRTEAAFFAAPTDADARIADVIAVVSAVLKDMKYVYKRDRAIGATGYKFSKSSIGLFLGAISRGLTRKGYAFTWDAAFEAKVLTGDLQTLVSGVEQRTQ